MSEERRQALERALELLLELRSAERELFKHLTLEERIDYWRARISIPQEDLHFFSA